MSNYRKTMTEALQEMVSLDERMRMPRQLIDTNKEVMIVKKNKVIVIDKKDQDKYMKQGWELAEEVGLNEGTIDKVKEIASKKSAKKIDGVMVDSFTASAISQIYDKVNDANKKKMEKLPITKLANLAFKMMQKNEFVPEEVDLDEKAKYTGKLMKNKSIVDYVKKQQEKNRKDVAKFGNKKVGAYGNEPRFDSGTGWNDMAADEIKLSSMSLNKRKSFDPEAEYEAIARKLGLDKFEPKLEEVELDEAKMSASQIAALKKAYEPMRGKKISMDSGKKLSAIMDKVDDDKQALIQLVKADIPFVSQLAITRLISKHDMKGAEINKLKEEVGLDEGKMGDQWQKGAKSVKSGPFELMRGKSGVHAIMQNGKKLGDFSYDDDADNFVANMKGMKGQWVGNDIDSLINHLQKVHKEEVEIEESKTTVPMSTKAGQSVKKGQVPKGMYGNAARDARRAMGRDPEMRQRAFSKDDDATDDDKKAASKNIMVQMRKAQSLGYFDVEFQDGKKIKIPAKLAIAVQQKYNAMRKPSDKEAFQSKVGKSYRDMLNALKEEAVSPAQQAAIAISKKERGEKPKKESILDRIDRKIKENKNG